MASSEGYTVRPFRPEDRGDVLSLFERSLYPDLGDRREEWFDWRFVDNPFASETPITVVDHEGSVVGARSNLPIPLSVGGRREVGILQAETAVRSAHRRRGLFTRMVEHDEAYYSTRDPVLSYGAPVTATQAALDAMGDRIGLERGVLCALPKYYRVENPVAIADGTSYERLAPLFRLLGPVLRAGIAATTSLASTPEGLTVRRHATLPVDLLVSLAESDRWDRGIHAVRDERFYCWRFANPRFVPRAYSAWRDGEPVACVVTEHLQRASPVILRVAEALPSGSHHEDGDVLPWLLERAVRDLGPDATIVLGSRVPGLELLAHGFYPRSAPPVSWLTGPSNFVARPMDGDGGGGEWRLHGCRLSDPSNWSLSWADLSF